MKKRFYIAGLIVLICIVALSLFYIHSRHVDQTKSVIGKETQHTKKRQQPKKPTPTPKDIPKEKNATIVGFKKNMNMKIPFAMKTYNIDVENCGGLGMIGPDFTTEDNMVFQVVSSRFKDSYIVIYNRKNKSCDRKIKVKGKDISNMTGIGHTVFWVVQDKTKEGIAWSIHSYNLNNHQKKMLKKGLSKAKTPPPVLRGFRNQLTWIEYDVSNHIVTSKLMVHDIRKNTTRVFTVTKLNEQNKQREGHYFYLAKPTSDGILMQETIFSPGEEKKARILLYSYQKAKKPIVLTQERKIIGLTEQDDWFVWTKSTGSVTVKSIKKDKVKYKFVDDSRSPLTFDSPVIQGHYLFFRYSSKQIFVADLKTGEYKELTGNENSRFNSKLVLSSKRISFARTRGIEAENVKFYVITKRQ